MRHLRFAFAALIAGGVLSVAPIAARKAYAFDPSMGKCSVTCARGSCSAEGSDCTCTCSLIREVASCTCGSNNNAMT
jgi:hypothetical protein